ncbi:MAG: hypothetical protein SF053_11720 [Bacteroidia bacterium]|nr:hypothetical protein [Bacteroidia bacterium]
MFRYFPVITFFLFCLSLAAVAQSPATRIVNTVTTAEDVSFKELAYLKAEWLPGRNIRYEAKMDGQPYTVNYQLRPKARAVVVTIKSPRDAASGLIYTVTETASGLLQFEIQLNGKTVGTAANQTAGQPVFIKASPELFASRYFEMLTFLPHEMTGFAPQDLFAPQADADPEMQAMGLKIGKWLGKLLGGIKLGGSCSKKTTVTYVCGQACAQVPGQECAGSMCGSICCCGGCTEQIITERECGGEVSVGK